MMTTPTIAIARLMTRPTVIFSERTRAAMSEVKTGRPPSCQIHGTITTGTGTAILISFQCPPDLVLYSGARDSSRAGAAPPKGVITPAAVKLMDFSHQNGFFVHPNMGSKRVAVAHRKLKPGEKFSTDRAEDGEQMLFVWKGALSVKSQQRVYTAGERQTVFISGRNSLEVRNSSAGEAIVIQVQAPPRSGWK